MLALVFTFLAGFITAIFSSSILRIFGPTSKAASPSAPPHGTLAAPTRSPFASPAPERGAQKPSLAIVPVTDASNVPSDSKVSSPRSSSAAARASLIARQASMSRSRAAIQVLNEAADLLRAQGDALAAAAAVADADEENLLLMSSSAAEVPQGSQEPQTAAVAVAVQRFLSRKLSRQGSYLSSSSATSVPREAPEGPAGGSPSDTAASGPAPFGGESEARGGVLVPAAEPGAVLAA